MSIMNTLKHLTTTVHDFLGGHHAAIQGALGAAQRAADAAVVVATQLGEDQKVIDRLQSVGHGIQTVSAGVNAATDATDLNGHAQALSATVIDLVNSGDIGIKNEATRAQIGRVARKAVVVVGALAAAK